MKQLFREHYYKINIPYMEAYDTKAKNVPILVKKDIKQNIYKDKQYTKIGDKHETKNK